MCQFYFFSTQNNTDVRLFGKPSIRPYRRMGVSLVYDEISTSMESLRINAKKAADCVVIN